MATNLADLLKQKEELDRQIQTLQTQRTADAIAQVRALMAEHGLTMSDITGANKSPKGTSSRAGVHVKPKYRDDVTGQTWSGRGLKPKWLSTALASGKKLADYTI